MIIGEDFVWLHFPKCAGVQTEKVLYKYFNTDPRIQFDEIDPLNVIWHQNIVERERSTKKKLKDKTILCNFRRLPFWILSRIQFEEKRSGIATTKDEYIHGKFREAGGILNHADVYVKFYTTPQVQRWIRTEFLASDFEAAFSPFLDLTSIDLRKEFSKKSNSTIYNKELSQWFGPEDLESLYSSCPLWAELELSLYGDLLTVSPGWEFKSPQKMTKSITRAFRSLSDVLGK